MTERRVALQPGYVLHQRPYRDSSALIEAFTPEYGRIGLVGRGIKRGKGQRAALLQPFRPLLLSWSGGGELATLSGVEGHGAAPRLSGNFLISGLYLNELLLRLLPRHDPQLALFGAYDATLRQLAELAQGGQPAGRHAQALRLFEKRVLEALGYGLVLDGEAGGAIPLQPAACYCYQLERGPVRTDGPCGEGIAVHGSTLLGLARESLETEAQLREAKRLMRAILGVHLGGRPLRSRELWRRERAPDAEVELD